MAYRLASSVEQEIERAFSAKHVEYVRSRLREKELPLDRSAPPPRVHIAVIWLSRGDIKRFDAQLEDACRDWRDTLVAAGLAHEDWKSILMQKGIDCDRW